MRAAPPSSRNMIIPVIKMEEMASNDVGFSTREVQQRLRMSWLSRSARPSAAMLMKSTVTMKDAPM